MGCHCSVSLIFYQKSAVCRVYWTALRHLAAGSSADPCPSDENRSSRQKALYSVVYFTASLFSICLPEASHIHKRPSLWIECENCLKGSVSGGGAMASATSAAFVEFNLAAVTAERPPSSVPPGCNCSSRFTGSEYNALFI